MIVDYSSSILISWQAVKKSKFLIWWNFQILVVIFFFSSYFFAFSTFCLFFFFLESKLKQIPGHNHENTTFQPGQTVPLTIVLLLLLFYLVIKCPALSIPSRAILLTTPCVATYGSNCSFSCQTGYLSSRGNVTRKCLLSGKWSGNSINCTGDLV